MSDLIDLLDPILDDPADPDMALPLPAESSGPAATTPTSQAPVVQPTTAPVVASSAAATTPPVQSSAAPVPEPVASSVAPSSAPAPVVSSQAPSSAAAVTSSSAPPVVIPSSTVTSTSTSTSASPSPSAAQSSASAVNNTSTVYVTASRSQPGLLNPSRVSSATGSSTALPASDKGGIGGSGLPLGGLVGIIIGGLAVIALIGLLVTRSMRKRARAKRTAHRSSMFEPWPAPVAMEDEPYEKPQSYPMHDNVAETYTDHNYANNYPEQGAYPGAMGYNDYPPQQYAAATAPLHPYPGQTGYSAEGTPYGGDIGAMGAAGVAGTGVAAAGSAAAAHGLQDGSMVRVKVGFVRSLEDELAITPGQQLYLHQAYDDGWSLCEDQAQNRGVVPISCLEPWDESSAAPVPSGNEQLASTGQRRSSLYRPNSGSY